MVIHSLSYLNEVNSPQNLLPLDAYRKDETGYWTRLAIFAGMLAGPCRIVSYVEYMPSNTESQLAVSA